MLSDLNLFGLVIINSAPFAWLVRHIWAGVKAVNQSLMRIKQPSQQHLKGGSLMHFVRGAKANEPTIGFYNGKYVNFSMILKAKLRTNPPADHEPFRKLP